MHAVNCLLSGKHSRCILLSGKKCFASKSFRDPKSQEALLKRCYRVLGVAEDCENEALRLAFVNLVKLYHPDGGTSDADAAKFSEIESAYRTIQKERSSWLDRDADLPKVEEFDIQHKAPQHRHYLQFDTGHGTPSERERRATAERAQKAAENVMEHNIQKIQATGENQLIIKDKSRAKDVKTRQGIDRLVEDLIQEAMSKGEFSDLPGSGKPLKDNSSSQNPYVDFTTHKMNQVLIDNGFTPEWIQLSKEIRENTRLIEERLAKVRKNFGPGPLSHEDSQYWQENVEKLRDRVKGINNQVDKYNLLVPILQKQMLHIDLQALANKTLNQPAIFRNEEFVSERVKNHSVGMDQSTFLDSLFSAFNKQK